MTHLAIGDFVYQGALLKALHKKYPHLTIDIWIDDCRKRPKIWHAGRNQILCQWLSKLPFIGEIYPIAASLDERDALIKQAQSHKYPLIFFIGKNRTEEYAKIARQISSNGFIVGSQAKPFFNPLVKWWHFNKLNGHFTFDKLMKVNEHITGLYLDCFNRAVGITEADLENEPQLLIDVPEHFTTAAQKQIALVHGESKKKVFISHLSTDKKRDYPWEQLKSLLLNLEKEYQGCLLVINTPPEKQDEINLAIAKDDELQSLNILPFTATENFYQLPAIMAECDLVISVETATAHLAVSVNVPQVTIMHNDLKLWQPKGNSIVLEGNGTASSVSVEQVMQAVERLTSSPS